MGIYEKYIKYPLDIIVAMCVLIILTPILIVIAIMIKQKLGSPIFYIQPRPGKIDPETGKERIFDLYKFRSMTNECNKNGELLPDRERLTSFGKWLREMSIDELPELINIIKGDMALIGPRPQLVRDLVFMTPEQRIRHTVRPGLSGLAQVRGRNAISWEEKLHLDIEYIQNITLWGDIKIVFETLKKVLIYNRVTNDKETNIMPDYGVQLLEDGKITKEEFDMKQEEARKLLEKRNC